ncbi:hypothetical protein JYU34_008970 [Plutella xylostella]|uniref:Ubiquitin-like-conjugating enzyme ATG10 n=1 Tax=Plutella xylostella TaxID=51655 RepID=A0ABQ7QM93_PLUXY|nr:hypothetical protein JYU34_008970 [Plutella xylostella]
MSIKMENCMNYEDYENAARKFIQISNAISDGWTLHEGIDSHSLHLRKETFLRIKNEEQDSLIKAEYVISYSTSYCVPIFAFNLWNSNGVLLTLEEIRNMAFIKISQGDFYSVITQQEHPLFFRPYYMIHPCHTEQLLSKFKAESKNLIVTFISLISPLIKFNLPLNYAM